MPVEWVIPAVALLLLVGGLLAHRRLVALQEAAAHAWSDVDSLFRQRHDLIPRLVGRIQDHVGPDSRPVRALMEARRAAANAPSPDAIGRAEAVLTAAIGKVLELAETKADLKTDAALQRLRAEFAAMEGRIEASGRAFNTAVQNYTQARTSLPAALVTYVVSFPALKGL